MFDTQIVNKEFLSEAFNASMIWGMVFQLRRVVHGMRAEIDEAITNRNTALAVDTEKRLLFVYDNLDNLEEILAEKELDLFDITEFGRVYKN